MPNVTLYIRNEDFKKWQNLPNKSEAISQLLNSKGLILDTPSIPRPTPVKPKSKDSIAPVNNMLKTTVDICPHSFAKGFCKKPECNRKYAK